MKDLKKNILFCFFYYSLLGAGFSFGQNSPVLFNDHSGLPGNSVYDCAESNTGKLWIATDKGLVNYDGYSFKKVGLNDGLTTMFSWGFCKDSKGRLWLRNRQSPFTYIYNDSIYRVGDNKITDIHFEWMTEDKEGNIYITSHKSNKTHRIDTKGNITIYDSILLLINSNNQQIWENDPLLTSIYPKRTISGDYVISMFMLDENNPCIELWNTLTNQKSKISIRFIENFNHVSYLDNQHVLISGSSGIYKLNLDTKNITPYGALYNTKYKDVVVIYRDRFGNKWLCDFSKGIWFEKALPSFISYRAMNSEDELTYFSKTSDDFISLTTTNNYSYIISKNGSEFKKSNRLLKREKTITSNSYLSSSFQGLELELYMGRLHLFKDKSKVEKELPFGKWSPLGNYRLMNGHYKCHFASDSLFSIGTSSGLYSIFVRADQIKVEHWHSGYVFDISGNTGNKSILYSVGLNGLQKVDIIKHTTETILDDPNLVNVCVTSDKIFVRKEDGVILIIDSKTKKVIKALHNFKDLRRIQLVDNEIWGIGEDRVLQFNTNNLDILLELNSFNGITNPYKLGIAKLGNHYYLICKNGYYKIDIKAFHRTNSESSTYFKVAHILVNGVKTSTKNIYLNGTNNSVQIALQCIYFPFSSKSVTYHYRINGGKWNVSTQPIINIINLPYGKYKLEIKARFIGCTSFFNHKMTINIDNPVPFYKSLTFIIFIFILILLSIVAFIIINRRRKITQLKQQFNMTQNRMKMLVMQMKPHFLSNVFNSLQTSFLEDDTIRSSQLIKDLDNYLRLSLSYSKKDVVSLYDEISLAKQYLSIEQNRLVKTVELIISENVTRQMGAIEVPVFILQPIIENAIWHGIQKSSAKSGKIIIDCNEETDNYFVITVEDDGIGIGKSNHKGNSVALDNINERLALIDNKRKTNYLFLEPLNPGTKVSLYVTKKIKNHSH